MAKFRTLGNLKDLGSDLVITIDQVPRHMSSKVQTDTSDIVKTVLQQYNYNGVWRLHGLIRHRAYHGGIPAFAAKAIAGVKGSKRCGIKIITKASSSRESCFECVLVPPDNLNADDVYHRLTKGPANNGKPLLSKSSTEPEESPPDIPVIKTAKTGAIYIGKVHNLTNYGAFVTIFPDNPSNQQDALCHVTEISDHYVADPGEELKVGQLIRVKCIGFRDGKPALSRKRLLPENWATLQKDDFVCRPDKRGVLSMKGFTASEERLAVALWIIKESIAKHATRAAWETIAEKGIEGHVFMEDKHHAFAPAVSVLDDLRNELCRQWRAKKISTSGSLMKKLIQRDYIYPVYDKTSGDTHAIGYCMRAEGYKFINCDPTPLPEYYEVPEQNDTAINNQQSSTNIPADEQYKETATLQDPTILLEQFALVEQYETRKTKLAQLNERLKDVDELIKERDSIQEWMREHESQALEQARLLDEIEQRFADRRARLSKLGDSDA